MKNSSIAESVYKINLMYVELQNKTKELFFQCLENNQDVAYFSRAVRELWGNVDHTFMEEEIHNYEEIIHIQNMELLGEKDVPQERIEEVLKLVPIGVVLELENKFIALKEKEYKKSKNSLAYKVNKEEYLKLKVQKYTNQIVPYFSRTTGKKIRDVELSTYQSMIHNTNLTRAGWNTTLADGYQMDYSKFYIPYHSFSCPYCIRFQNKPLTRKEVMKLVGHEEEHAGEILHPNCKCVLVLYDKYIDYRKPNYSKKQLEEQYHIRQKVNSLTLEKEKIRTDMKIQEGLGNYDEVDTLNQQRNKINKEIRTLKEALPTTELKKQVVAINR